MNPRAIALPILVALALPGCAFYPVLDDQEDFKPATEKGFQCNTQDYDKAMLCASKLEAELSELMKGVHQYNLFSSYAAWFLGSVTGGVLAFDGGEDALKGLAVGAGSLIGLNAVVKPEEQRKIASAAQMELSCIVSVAESVRNAQGNPDLLRVAGESQAAINGITSARQGLVTQFYSTARGKKNPDPQVVIELFKAQEQDQQYLVLAETALAVSQSVGTSAEIGGKLSKAVLRLRQRVIDQLTANSTIDEGAANKQRDLIVGMAGRTVKKRGDLKRQQEAASPSTDPEHEKAMQSANSAAAGTASIDAALADCIDPTTVEALRR